MKITMTNMAGILVVAASALCTFGCGSTTVGPRTYNVVYSASVTGSDQMSVLSYDDGTGNKVVVTAPASPWTKTMTMKPGATVWIQAKLTTLNGTVTAAVSANDNAGHPVIQEDETGGTSNIPVEYVAQTDSVQLP
ncbi:MAG: hypothetical protein WC889_10085 [Myxococcota bacterium]